MSNPPPAGGPFPPGRPKVSPQLLRSPSAMQVASRTEEADQAIRSLPTGHSRNISDIPLANDKQRARVSQRTSRTSSSAWNAPYSDRATALQTRIEASTSTIGEHGGAQIPAGAIAHRSAALLSGDDHIKGRAMHKTLAAGSLATAGTPEGPAVQAAESSTSGPSWDKRLHAAHTEGSLHMTFEHLRLGQASGVYTTEQTNSIQGGLYIAEAAKQKRIRKLSRLPPLDTYVPSPDLQLGPSAPSLHSHSLVDPVRLRSVAHGEPIHGNATQDHARSMSSTQLSPTFDLTRLASSPSQLDQPTTVDEARRERAVLKSDLMVLERKARDFYEAALPFRAPPVISLVKNILIEISGTADKRGGTGKEADLMRQLRNFVLSLTKDPWYPKALALEALASDLFEQRTTLCHPREPEELEAVVAIHEMIKNLDTSHNLGLFATNDPAHFLASPSGLAAVSRLPSYKAAVAARKGAARPPRRQGETSTHKSQKLSFDCPPNPPGDVAEPGALLSTDTFASHLSRLPPIAAPPPLTLMRGRAASFSKTGAFQSSQPYYNSDDLYGTSSHLEAGEDLSSTSWDLSYPDDTFEEPHFASELSGPLMPMPSSFGAGSGPSVTAALGAGLRRANSPSLPNLRMKAAQQAYPPTENTYHALEGRMTRRQSQSTLRREPLYQPSASSYSGSISNSSGPWMHLQPMTSYPSTSIGGSSCVSHGESLRQLSPFPTVSTEDDRGYQPPPPFRRHRTSSNRLFYQ